MKPIINHITPRAGTKRCAALQTRANEILHKRLLEYGAVDVDQSKQDADWRYPLLMDLATDYGTLRFTVHKERGDSNIFALFSCFETMDSTLVAAAAKILGSNPYSGKWNHFARLDYDEMENMLGTLAYLIPKIIADKKARALSEPNY